MNKFALHATDGVTLQQITEKQFNQSKRESFRKDVPLKKRLILCT
jgi:hypothetical protein